MLLPVNKSFHYSLRRVFHLTLLCLLLISFTSCDKQPKFTGPPEKITIAYSTIHKDMPNYLDFIYTDGLLAVKPEAVWILR